MKKLSIGGAAIAAVLAIVTPSLKTYEGYSADPYRDQVGKLTVCFGETQVRMRRYTLRECNAMLDNRVTEFATIVATRNPNLVNHPNQWAAATSLTYNIGGSAYSHSTVAKEFAAGRWQSACNHFTDWKYAGGRVNQGLLNRRLAEKSRCIQQLPPSA